MGKVGLNGMMDLTMKDSLLTDILWVKVNTTLLIQINITKENSDLAIWKEGVQRRGLMEEDMMVSSKMEEKMEKEFLNGQMV